MNVYEILVAITKVMDQNDLRKINEALKTQFNHVGQIARYQFSIGDRVKFFNNRDHVWVVGKIVKKNPKYIVVKPDEGFVKWNVSPGSLQHVE